MEYSIINFRYIKGIPDTRIDAECYEPDFLKVEKLMSELNSETINELSKSVINFGAYSLCNYIQFSEKGIPFIVTEDINNNLINNNNFHYVSSEIHQILHKSHCRNGQVLLTMAGAYLGQAAVYDFEFVSSSNQAIAKITLNDNTIDPYFLSTFINSKYGQLQIERYRTGTGQPNLNLGLIKTLTIPILSTKFQESIKNTILLAKKTLQDSINFYNEAEDLLLEELGLKSSVFEEELSYVVNYSDVIYSNRIDADYFQPKYQKLIEKIKSKNAKTLRELVSMRKGFEPGSEAYQEEGKLFIRVSSVSKLGIEETEQKYLSQDLYQKLKKDYEPKLGDILLTKDASPGIAYFIKEPLEGIISGGILDLKVKENIESEYLALCINSIVGQWQAQRDAGGSIIVHWKSEQVKNLVIPILPTKIQKEIAELVRKSHEARKKSKVLLEEAKRKVEGIIEKRGEN